jgi:hypothetical protein
MHIHVYYNKLTHYDTAANNKPFSGGPGGMFLHRTFDKHPDITYDVRVVNTPAAYAFIQPNARILCLGAESLKAVLQLEPLNKHRGYVLRKTPAGPPIIATYAPIDAWSFKAQDEDDDDDDAADEKDVANTKRQNYFFWMLADFAKLVKPAFTPPRNFTTTIKPTASAVTKWIDGRAPGSRIILDIETRIQDHSLDCIGLGDCGRYNSIVIPFYDWRNVTVYSAKELALIWRSLYKLFRRPDITIVGHNLAFDLSVLAARYCLPLPINIYDTMLAMHRQFPLVEKSLSHAISFYTDAGRNHKGDIAINTTATNYQQLLRYNGDDLSLTAAVLAGQAQYHAADPALAHAVAEANKLQLVTLNMSLAGICVDLDQLAIHKRRLAARNKFLTACCAFLSGLDEFNPASPKQVAEYFYDRLRYEVPEYTKTGARSAGTKTLYKLQVKQNNPLIPLIIETREVRKALSMFEANLYQRMALV